MTGRREPSHAIGTKTLANRQRTNTPAQIAKSEQRPTREVWHPNSAICDTPKPDNLNSPDNASRSNTYCERRRQRPANSPVNSLVRSAAASCPVRAVVGRGLTAEPRGCCRPTPCQEIHRNVY